MFNIKYRGLLMTVVQGVKVCWNRFGFHFRQGCYFSKQAGKGNRGTKLHAHRSTQGHVSLYTHSHTNLQVDCRHLPNTVFPSSIVTVGVTDLISPTICWLEAQRRRSYPGWQIQTASVFACFSQGLAQYGEVKSVCWPPNLHPYITASKDRLYMEDK